MHFSATLLSPTFYFILRSDNDVLGQVLLPGGKALLGGGAETADSRHGTQSLLRARFVY